MSHFLNTVRIHSEIADKKAAVKLWYYCRLCSDNGMAFINLKEVSKYFQVTLQTVRNWFSWCVKNNYIRSYSTDYKGNYRVFYSSLKKVSNYSDFGIVASVELNKHKSLKVLATEIVTQHLQNVVFHSAKHKYSKIKKKDRKFLRKARNNYELFDSPPSKLMTIGVLGRTKRFILVDHNYNCHGVTYKYIADTLYRSESTVKRRLKNVEKAQLAQNKNDYYAEYYFAKEEFKDNKFIFCKVDGKKLLFKALTNVYNVYHELNSMRYLRKFLKSLKS